jgi:putative membrane protein
MRQQMYLALKGAAMGVAETIPGVSGGTIAFITGIYERLINSIKAFGPSLVQTWKQQGLKGAWKAIDGNFLVVLVAGMAVGLVASLKGVSYLLEHYPPVIWAFFFGLIIGSIVYVGSQVQQRNFGVFLAFLIGTAVAFSITQVPMANANDNLLFIFVCGAVSVSAFILPGISGSFILLLLGMYTFILHDTLKDGVLEQQDPQAFLIMGVFGLGMVIGLATFSRVLSWAFRSYHDTTLALLSGFMFGALNKIWPWRIPTLVMTEDGDRLKVPEGGLEGIEMDKVLDEIVVLPSRYSVELGESSFLVATIISMVVGFVVVLYLDNSTKVKI